MKTKKLKIRILPNSGRIIVNAFVFINGKVLKAINVTNETVTVIDGEETIDYPKIAIKLAKYLAFSLNGRLIGELSWEDYDKVSDGMVIVGEVIPKSSPVEIGDKVRIIKPELHNLEKCIRCYYEGVVIKCTSRIFTVAIPDANITFHRHQIKLINKPNFRNIIKYIKTI